MRSGLIRLILACTVLYCADTAAATSVKMDKKDPVYLEAEEVGYDQETSTVEAIGKVQIIQGEHVIFADRVTYNQDTDIVTASGHVSELEADGNVYFSDDLEVERDMSEGVVQNFRARLKDNSLFAAREAQKIDKNTTLVKNAVYSPCKVCARTDGTDKPPMWRMTSQRAKIDEEAQRIYYYNAYMDVYGVPIFYTPYYSTPMPGSPSESGLLTPEYSHDKNLGYVVKAPLYITYAPNMDSTFTPIYTDLGPVLAAQFRHLTHYGTYELGGSVTNAQAFDSSGIEIPGKNDLRWHVQGKGNFAIDDIYGGGFDFKRASDDTYLRLYRFGAEDKLTSKFFLDRISGRNYASVNALSFQGLESTDNSKTIPDLIPTFDTHLESNPLWAGSHLFLDGNAYSFNRRTSDSSSRGLIKTGWQLPIITRGGQIYEFGASVRADEYNVQDVAFGNKMFDGSTARLIPEFSLNWRYPLINRFNDGTSLTLEPTINGAISPSRKNSNKIPNQDSLSSEFSDTNLFSLDRFSGYDQIETGPRFNYGLRGDYALQDTRRLTFMLGQAWQKNNDNMFPLAEKIGLNFSDIVGQIGGAYDKFDASYRFRLSTKNWISERNEIDAHYNGEMFSLGLGYISLDNAPGIANQNQISGSGSITLWDNWTFQTSARRDLSSANAGMREATGGLVYHNECVTITNQITHDFLHDRDINSGTSYIFRIGLKNLE